MSFKRLEPPALTDRKALPALEPSLTPATSVELADRLQVLFATFPTSESGDPGMRVRAYLMALSDFGADAVTQAITAVIKGNTDLNPRFLPTPPELAQLCRGIEARKEGLSRTTFPPALPMVAYQPAEAGYRRMAEKAREAAEMLGDYAPRIVNGEPVEEPAAGVSAAAVEALDRKRARAA